MLREFTLKDVHLLIHDEDSSCATQDFIAYEIFSGEYDDGSFNISPGDVIVDIGAHVGMVSIYLAKKYPNARIYSYEPNPTNFGNFMKNLEINGVTSITPFNLAVTSDGRSVCGTLSNPNNTGCSTIYEPNNIRPWNSESTTLNDIIKDNGIDKIRVLKMDCEGSEYEIMYNTYLEDLSGVGFMVGEFHMTGYIARQYNMFELIEFCYRHIDNFKISCIDLDQKGCIKSWFRKQRL